MTDVFLPAFVGLFCLFCCSTVHFFGFMFSFRLFWSAFFCRIEIINFAWPVHCKHDVVCVRHVCQPHRAVSFVSFTFAGPWCAVFAVFYRPSHHAVPFDGVLPSLLYYASDCNWLAIRSQLLLVNFSLRCKKITIKWNIEKWRSKG